MGKNLIKYFCAIIMVFGYLTDAAQNPIIRDQFSADPSARVFGNEVYLYPSHDILAVEGKGRVGWFCMEDYHVFSSTNLTEWTDHGVIISQDNTPWVKPSSYSMWAPDCIEKNGKYYFYFPTTPRDSSFGKGFTIGVAIANNPAGPFIPAPLPIKNVHGIDPNVFIDKDGQAYLYWAQGNIYCAKLKENMLELASEPKILGDLPDKGLKEGPYLFERNGIYYLTYPHVENKTERLEYAVSNNPLGPFTITGVIMDESPTGCWTNHQSIIQFKDQWYLFYHHNDYSPGFDKARSVRVDSLSFNMDGTIKKVIPTLRGIGLTDASKRIEIDRYSKLSGSGASIAFIDTLDRFKGWKTIFDGPGAWAQYNNVDFGKQKFKTIYARVESKTGAILQVHLNDSRGRIIAEVAIPANSDWNIVKAPIARIQQEIYNLVVVVKNGDRSAIDYLYFE